MKKPGNAARKSVVLRDNERLELNRFIRNFLAQHDSAVLYEALAKLEGDTRQKAVWAEFAAAEREHAKFWADRLRTAGAIVPVLRVSRRAKMLAQLARWLGGGRVIPVITTRALNNRSRL
jgi:vacuolar iron transporter family protein